MDLFFLCPHLIFSVCAPPPQLSGCILFAHPPPPPDAPAIFPHNDLQCNDTSSVIGGGHKRQRSKEIFKNIENSSFVSELGLLILFFRKMLSEKLSVFVLPSGCN